MSEEGGDNGFGGSKRNERSTFADRPSSFFPAKENYFAAGAAGAAALAARLREHVPGLRVRTGHNDAAAHDLVVNATPLGMRASDPPPTDLTRLTSGHWVAEVVMSAQPTPLMEKARQLGCPLQVGTDMLFEQIPAYLEYFGLPSTTADHLRQVAQLDQPQWSPA